LNRSCSIVRRGGASLFGRQPPRRKLHARRKGWSFIPVLALFSRRTLEREGEDIWFRERKKEIEMKKTGLYSFISKNEPVWFMRTELVLFGSIPFFLNPLISIPFWSNGCVMFSSKSYTCLSTSWLRNSRTRPLDLRSNAPGWSCLRFSVIAPFVYYVLVFFKPSDLRSDGPWFPCF